jgi:hypothetical protein
MLADTYSRPTFQRREVFRVRVHLDANLHLGELAELDGLEPVAGCPHQWLGYPESVWTTVGAFGCSSKSWVWK